VHPKRNRLRSKVHDNLTLGLFLIIFFFCSVQNAFQHFYFQGGRGIPLYGPVLRINPFSVVHPNLSHLRTLIHEHLAPGQLFKSL